jgi:hypothetical protein
MSKEKLSFRLGSLGYGMVGLDILICLFNGFAVGWMLYKAYQEKNIEYVERLTFVHSAVAATSLVAIFGTIGNLLMLGGIRIGVRLAGYRIALGIGSVVLAWAMMFFLIPKPERIMSEHNFTTYVWFLSVGLAYILWILGYWAAVASASKRAG